MLFGLMFANGLLSFWIGDSGPFIQTCNVPNHHFGPNGDIMVEYFSDIELTFSQI